MRMFYLKGLSLRCPCRASSGCSGCRSGSLYSSACQGRSVLQNKGESDELDMTTTGQNGDDAGHENGDRIGRAGWGGALKYTTKCKLVPDSFICKYQNIYKYLL